MITRGSWEGVAFVGIAMFVVSLAGAIVGVVPGRDAGLAMIVGAAVTIFAILMMDEG